MFPSEAFGLVLFHLGFLARLKQKNGIPINAIVFRLSDDRALCDFPPLSLLATS